jgi:oligopeptide transport system substrate-binding protein
MRRRVILYEVGPRLRNFTASPAFYHYYAFPMAVVSTFNTGRWGLTLTFALTSLLILAGCGDHRDTDSRAPPAADGVALKVYRHGMDESPTSLDPVQGANVYANHVLINAYDTLYAYKYLARPYEIKPNLAKGWPKISDDKLTYVIPIKEGVRFVDDPAFPAGVGRELVAADIVYSIKRHFDPATRAQGAWLWQDRIVGLDEWKSAGSDYDAEIEGLRALDRYTLQIKLTQPYPQLLDTLAQGYASVVPREAVEHYGREFAIHPVGSGPFRVVSYDTTRIVMDRNPGYRQEPVDLAAEGYDPATQGQYRLERIAGRSPPFIDRLEIHFIGENSARWNSFTKGDEIQYTQVPNEQVDQVLASKQPVRLKPRYADKYYVYAGTEAGFIFQTFNLSMPEFGYNPDPQRERRNKALRCAVIKAFDWPARNESFYSGIGLVFPGIIVPVVAEFDPDLSPESVTRDVDGARRLLAENGWNAENLPVFTYGTRAGVINRLMYEQFRAWLKQIGYPPEKIVLKQYATFGDISKAWKQAELPWVFKGWGLDYPDAENTLQLFYGPNSSPGSNDANYRNPEYDRLYDQARVMLPSPERTQIYRRMNQMVIDDCLAVTGMARTRIYVWHKNVIALPDREIVGGFFLKYVDLED